MDIFSGVLKTALFFTGIAAGYIAVTWPFFAYRLVRDGHEILPADAAAGVRKSRAYLLAVVGLGWLASAVIGLALQRGLSLDSWALCGMPFSLGWAYAMFAVPLRFWNRLGPWRW
jgi:hypothetical protein